MPVAMHLAESPEELQLLKEGKGPFQEILEERGMWDPWVIGRGSCPMDYLANAHSGSQVARHPRQLPGAQRPGDDGPARGRDVARLLPSHTRSLQAPDLPARRSS